MNNAPGLSLSFTSATSLAARGIRHDYELFDDSSRDGVVLNHPRSNMILAVWNLSLDFPVNNLSRTFLGYHYILFLIPRDCFVYGLFPTGNRITAFADQDCLHLPVLAVLVSPRAQDPQARMS